MVDEFALLSHAAQPKRHAGRSSKSASDVTSTLIAWNSISLYHLPSRAARNENELDDDKLQTIGIFFGKNNRFEIESGKKNLETVEQTKKKSIE
jgi:hypothetical protein